MAGAPDVLGDYSSRIEEYTETLLRPYLDRLGSATVGSVQSKEFNDPVWGTITLDAAEVVVLDSPLVQRLRRIRQLGVVQYVYPGANHTRLEHSIGVCHQVQRLTTSIENHGGEEGYGALPDEWVSILRMAGLCHDVGHGLMSHVVENALRSDEACIDLILAFQRNVSEKDSESQLSEIAAYYMLRSAAFSELIEHAHRIAGKPNVPGMHDRMADCVIGISNDESVPLIHELISGPFDCDKLDYMTRDALMCGVPVVTDVTRLIQKVRAVEVRTDRLPDGLAAVVEDKGGAHKIVALARSGASTLHEVSLGRSLMHDKIYRHHKVRATEAMVAGVLSQIGPLIEPFTPMLPLAIYDDEFLALDQEWLERRAAGGMTPTGVAIDLTQRLRDRRLFVRAFAFSQKMPFDAYKDDQGQRAAIEELIRDADGGSSRQDLVDAIVERLRLIVDKLGLSTLLDSLANGDPTPYVWIDPPVVKKKSENDTDQSRAYLVDHGRELVPMGKVSAETRGWADAYINTRDVGYVFCPRELVDYVHVATEVVLRLERGITIPREMHSYAKVESSSASAIRSALAETDFYDDLPRDLRPLPDFLTKAATERRLQAAAARIAGYMGPSVRRDMNKAEGGALNTAKIRDWVAQFDGDDAELALTLVEGTLLLDRKTINTAVSAFLSDPKNKVFRGGSLVPLGQAKDGSAIITYYSGDVAEEFGCEVQSLPEALVSSDRPLIFIDDIVQRGSSVISIFEGYLGLPDTQDLNEGRPDALADEAQRALRSRKIAVVTSAGMTIGIQTIADVLASYELDVTVYSHYRDQDLPTVRSVLAASHPDKLEGFEHRCSEVGAALFHEHPKQGERRLGYGNTGLLVVSSFNTPTMTLTALWRGGQVDGAEWRPLFPRRPKK